MCTVSGASIILIGLNTADSFILSPSAITTIARFSLFPSCPSPYGFPHPLHLSSHISERKQYHPNRCYNSVGLLVPTHDALNNAHGPTETLAFAQYFCAAASISLTLPTASAPGSTPSAVRVAGTSTTATASESGQQTATTSSAGSPTVASAAAPGTASSSGAGGPFREGWWREWVWVWVWVLVGVWIGWV